MAAAIVVPHAWAFWKDSPGELLIPMIWKSLWHWSRIWNGLCFVFPCGYQYPVKDLIPVGLVGSQYPVKGLSLLEDRLRVSKFLYCEPM